MELRAGDRARVIAETGDDRFPLDTIVVVVEIISGFGPGPDKAVVYRAGKTNLPETALPVTALERI
jgi:hypothetical protein